MQSSIISTGWISILLILFGVSSWGNSFDPEFKSFVLKVEKKFAEQGIKFDQRVNREKILGNLGRVFDYFDEENDPGASKRLTYLLTLMRYANFKRVTGKQLNILVSDISSILKEKPVSNDIGKDSKEAKNFFDTKQILELTNYFEKRNTPSGFELIFYTNCPKETCTLSLNPDAINQKTKKTMNENGIKFSHLEYKKVLRLKVLSDEHINASLNEIENLITEKSSVGVYEMDPKAPDYVPSKYRTLSVEDSKKRGSQKVEVIDIPSYLSSYLRRLRYNQVELVPLVIGIDGFSLKVKWDKRQAGGLGVFLGKWRTIRFKSFAIFPQYLDNNRKYSPIVMHAFDNVWRGVYKFIIKVGR